MEAREPVQDYCEGVVGVNNSDKIILDLCGGTGAWSKPYKDAGYDVKVITLPEQDVMFYEPPPNVYGILAAPVCTMFSIARTTAKTPRNFEEGMKLVRRCLEIVWDCRAAGTLKFWALENPRGYLRQFLGRPAFEFKHWEFGDIGIKPTDIWGYFDLPIKTVSKQPAGLTKKFPNGKINSVKWPNQIKRAITPAGFAKAFYKANK